MIIPKYNLMPSLSYIVEDAIWAERFYINPLPSINELFNEYSIFHRQYILFEQDWIKRDKELRNDLLTIHKVIDITYESIKTMVFQSFEEKHYSPECLDCNKKNEFYFQFIGAVKNISEDTLDIWRLKRLESFLEQYSALNYKLFDCENITIRFVKYCFSIYSFLPALVSEIETVFLKYPVLTSIPKGLKLMEVHEYLEKKDFALAVVYDILYNRIGKLILVFKNGKINEEFNYAIQKIIDLRLSNYCNIFNKVITH